MDTNKIARLKKRKMKNTLIITENQTHFLAEKRQDPITGDSFSIGNEIVFCAECKSAFLKESWEYMGNRHCNQSQTLYAFPKKTTIIRKTPVVVPKSKRKKNTKKIIEIEETELKKVSYEMRALSVLYDLVLCYFAGGFLSIFIFVIFDIEPPEYYIGLFLFLIRDIILKNGSVGKRLAEMLFLDIQTERSPSWIKMLIATSIRSIQSLIAIYLFTQSKTSTEFTMLIIGFILYQIYIMVYQISPIDRLLKIALIRKE